MPRRVNSPSLYPDHELEGVRVIGSSLNMVSCYPFYHLSNPSPYLYLYRETYLDPFASLVMLYEVVEEAAIVCEWMVQK
jgi:hypothetical protein